MEPLPPLPEEGAEGGAPAAAAAVAGAEDGARPAVAAPPRYEGSPRYVQREGSPGILEENISPAELDEWVSRYLDWQRASWVNGPPSQGALVTQAKLLLSQAWLDTLVDKLEWSTISFRDLVRALEKCLHVK